VSENYVDRKVFGPKGDKVGSLEYYTAGNAVICTGYRHRQGSKTENVVMTYSG